MTWLKVVNSSKVNASKGVSFLRKEAVKIVKRLQAQNGVDHAKPHSTKPRPNLLIFLALQEIEIES